VDKSIAFLEGCWLFGDAVARSDRGEIRASHHVAWIDPSAGTFGRAGRRPCSLPGQSAQLNEAANPDNIASLTTRARQHSEPLQRPSYLSRVLCVPDDSRWANGKTGSGELSSNIIQLVVFGGSRARSRRAGSGCGVAEDDLLGWCSPELGTPECHCRRSDPWGAWCFRSRAGRRRVTGPVRHARGMPQAPQPKSRASRRVRRAASTSPDRKTSGTRGCRTSAPPASTLRTWRTSRGTVWRFRALPARAPRSFDELRRQIGCNRGRIFRRGCALAPTSCRAAVVGCALPTERLAPAGGRRAGDRPDHGTARLPAQPLQSGGCALIAGTDQLWPAAAVDEQVHQPAATA
jgi:hypothetical protein